MIDLKAQVVESFERLYPIPMVAPEWDDVLDRARTRPNHRFRPFALMTMRRRLALVGALAGAIGVALLAVGVLGESPRCPGASVGRARSKRSHPPHQSTGGAMATTATAR